MQPRTARLVLRFVGTASILFASFGLWYNAGTISAYRSGTFSGIYAGQPVPFFDSAFLTLSMFSIVCFITLAWCGIQFIRLSFSWLWLFIAVATAELLAVAVVGSLWLNSTYGLSIAAATGISMGGFTPQLLLLFPLWGPVTVWLIRKSSLKNQPLTHHSSGTPNGAP